MRTRRAESIRPAYAGELRVLAVTPEAGDQPDLGQLRGWLLPDLIRRCAERRGLVVTTCEIASPATVADSASQAGSGSQAAGAGLGPAGGALNVYPPARIAPAGEPIERTVEFVAPGSGHAAPGDPPPFDVGTGDGEWLTGRDLTRHVAAPAGTVTFDGQKVTAGPAGAPSLDDVASRGLDPLAVRLVLLGRHYRDDLDLTWDALKEADQTLSRWRERVAAWALSPSAAMLRGYADAVTGAFEDDLDTPTALRELRTLEADDDAPAGARFETFASMDRLLGLDLARDIGR